MGLFSCFAPSPGKLIAGRVHVSPPHEQSPSNKHVKGHPQVALSEEAAEDYDNYDEPTQSFSSEGTVSVHAAGSSVSSCASTNIPLRHSSNGAVAWSHVSELAEEVAELKRRLLEEEEEAKKLREEVLNLRCKDQPVDPIRHDGDVSSEDGGAVTDDWQNQDGNENRPMHSQVEKLSLLSGSTDMVEGSPRTGIKSTDAVAWGVSLSRDKEAVSDVFEVRKPVDTKQGSDSIGEEADLPSSPRPTEFHAMEGIRPGPGAILAAKQMERSKDGERDSMSFARDSVDSQYSSCDSHHLSGGGSLGFWEKRPVTAGTHGRQAPAPAYEEEPFDLAYIQAASSEIDAPSPLQIDLKFGTVVEGARGGPRQAPEEMVSEDSAVSYPSLCPDLGLPALATNESSADSVPKLTNLRGSMESDSSFALKPPLDVQSFIESDSSPTMMPRPPCQQVLDPSPFHLTDEPVMEENSSVNFVSNPLYYLDPKSSTRASGKVSRGRSRRVTSSKNPDSTLGPCRSSSQLHANDVSREDRPGQLEPIPFLDFDESAQSYFNTSVPSSSSDRSFTSSSHGQNESSSGSVESFSLQRSFRLLKQDSSWLGQDTLEFMPHGSQSQEMLQVHLNQAGMCVDNPMFVAVSDEELSIESGRGSSRSGKYGKMDDCKGTAVKNGRKFSEGKEEQAFKAREDSAVEMEYEYVGDLMSLDQGYSQTVSRQKNMEGPKASRTPPKEVLVLPIARVVWQEERGLDRETISDEDGGDYSDDSHADRETTGRHKDAAALGGWSKGMAHEQSQLEREWLGAHHANAAGTGSQTSSEDVTLDAFHASEKWIDILPTGAPKLEPDIEELSDGKKQLASTVQGCEENRIEVALKLEERLPGNVAAAGLLPEEPTVDRAGPLVQEAVLENRAPERALVNLTSESGASAVPMQAQNPPSEETPASLPPQGEGNKIPGNESPLPAAEASERPARKRWSKRRLVLSLVTGKKWSSEPVSPGKDQPMPSHAVSSPNLSGMEADHGHNDDSRAAASPPSPKSSSHFNRFWKGRSKPASPLESPTKTQRISQDDDGPSPESKEGREAHETQELREGAVQVHSCCISPGGRLVESEESGDGRVAKQAVLVVDGAAFPQKVVADGKAKGSSSLRRASQSAWRVRRSPGDQHPYESIHPQGSSSPSSPFSTTHSRSSPSQDGSSNNGGMVENPFVPLLILSETKEGRKLEDFPFAATRSRSTSFDIPPTVLEDPGQLLEEQILSPTELSPKPKLTFLRRALFLGKDRPTNSRRAGRGSDPIGQVEDYDQEGAEADHIQSSPQAAWSGSEAPPPHELEPLMGDFEKGHALEPTGQTEPHLLPAGAGEAPEEALDRSKQTQEISHVVPQSVEPITSKEGPFWLEDAEAGERVTPAGDLYGEDPLQGQQCGEHKLEPEAVEDVVPNLEMAKDPGEGKAEPLTREAAGWMLNEMAEVEGVRITELVNEGSAEELQEREAGSGVIADLAGEQGGVLTPRVVANVPQEDKEHLPVELPDGGAGTLRVEEPFLHHMGKAAPEETSELAELELSEWPLEWKGELSNVAEVGVSKDELAGGTQREAPLVQQTEFPEEAGAGLSLEKEARSPWEKTTEVEGGERDDPLGREDAEVSQRGAEPPRQPQEATLPEAGMAERGVGERAPAQRGEDAQSLQADSPVQAKAAPGDPWMSEENPEQEPLQTMAPLQSRLEEETRKGSMTPDEEAGLERAKSRSTAAGDQFADGKEPAKVPKAVEARRTDGASEETSQTSHISMVMEAEDWDSSTSALRTSVDKEKPEPLGMAPHTVRGASSWPPVQTVLLARPKEASPEAPQNPALSPVTDLEERRSRQRKQMGGVGSDSDDNPKKSNGFPLQLQPAPGRGARGAEGNGFVLGGSWINRSKTAAAPPVKEKWEPRAQETLAPAERAQEPEMGLPAYKSTLGQDWKMAGNRRTPGILALALNPSMQLRAPSRGDPAGTPPRTLGEEERRGAPLGKPASLSWKAARAGGPGSSYQGSEDGSSVALEPGAGRNALGEAKGEREGSEAGSVRRSSRSEKLIKESNGLLRRTASWKTESEGAGFLESLRDGGRDLWETFSERSHSGAVGGQQNLYSPLQRVTEMGPHYVGVPQKMEHVNSWLDTSVVSQQQTGGSWQTDSQSQSQASSLTRTSSLEVPAGEPARGSGWRTGANWGRGGMQPPSEVSRDGQSMGSSADSQHEGIGDLGPGRWHGGPTGGAAHEGKRQAAAPRPKHVPEQPASRQHQPPETPRRAPGSFPPSAAAYSAPYSGPPMPGSQEWGTGHSGHGLSFGTSLESRSSGDFSAYSGHSVEYYGRGGRGLRGDESPASTARPPLGRPLSSRDRPQWQQQQQQQQQQREAFDPSATEGPAALHKGSPYPAAAPPHTTSAAGYESPRTSPSPQVQASMTSIGLVGWRATDRNSISKKDMK